MKNLALTASALALMAGSAAAGGLDRSYQSVSAIFADPNTASLSFGYVQPSVTGTDALGNSYDVGDSYSQLGMSYTNSVGSAFSYAFIYDQPYGANTTYNNNPATSTLGGTAADLSSNAFSLIGKYQITDRVSVFGGVRAESVKAKVALNGQAYANAIGLAAVARRANMPVETLAAALQGDVIAVQLAGGWAAVAELGLQVSGAVTGFLATGGYEFSMEEDYALGYTVGAAYEIPDIAFRLAATYHSEIDHSAATNETMFGSPTASTVGYVTPQSVNVEFQTGIAANTLLMASYRWTEFSAVDVIPTALGSDLVNLDDANRWTLGIGRKFSDNFSGSINLIYEPDGGSATVSPLGPTDGQMGISIGGRYTNGGLNISGGINYTVLGDADAGVAGQSVASFTDNSATAIGFKMEFKF